MVQMHRQGKPVFLRGHHVVDGDLAIIVEPPYIVSAEKTKFGKERTVITIKVKRTGEIYRWSLNTTTNDRFVDKFGEEGNVWKDREIKIQRRVENVGGEEKPVLYGVPSTQTNLQAPAAASDTS